ncbi:MAG TPA: ribonuclease P protein component [Methylomirabilota bacterium]|nr:ribonuclease P protein component [Methylomirabilota bacterium]
MSRRIAASPPPGATLARSERLRDRGEFHRLFRRGARLDGPSFVLIWLAAAGPRAAAFATSRRVGGSVARNRIRRRLREAYRRQKALVPAAGLRLCFVARPRAGEVPFADLTQEMAEALQQAARRLAS